MLWVCLTLRHSIRLKGFPMQVTAAFMREKFFYLHWLQDCDRIEAPIFGQTSQLLRGTGRLLLELPRGRPQVDLRLLQSPRGFHRKSGYNVIKLFTAVIYRHSMVVPSFCVIKQHYLGNYCRMAVNCVFVPCRPSQPILIPESTTRVEHI